MTATENKPRWKAMRTEETIRVEDFIKQAGFENVDAYRYNSASIRVRVIDPRFEGLQIEERDSFIEPLLHKLPERTQGDLTMLLTLAPSEVDPDSKNYRSLWMNSEFDDPSPSRL